MRQSRPIRTALLVAPVAAVTLVGTAIPGHAIVSAGPAITVRSSSSATRTSGTSISVGRPIGAVAGDVLVARIAHRGSVTAALTAPGWTTVGATSSGTLMRSAILFRVLTTTEPSSYTFNVNAASGLVASITALDNVDTARPVVSYVGKVNTDSKIFATPSVITSVGNTMSLWFGTQLFAGSDCGSAQVTPPPVMSEVVDGCLVGASGLVFETAYRQLGAAATRTGWAGSSASAQTNITQAITLSPAAHVQEANAYTSASIDVGTLWEGYTSAGGLETRLADSVLHEPSGLAASRVNANVQYVHSESDVKGMVAISTLDARVLGKYVVAIPQQWDWEDIATGPCPRGTCIFAGDIGRANGKPNPPSTFAVYRVPEPNIAAGQTSGTLTGDWFRFRYPDVPHNAEALMVHPDTGRIYVITKSKDGRSGVYAFPTTLPPPSATTVTTLTKVATLNVPVWTGDPANKHAAIWYAQVTAASIHPAGNRFLIRTPYRVYEYRGTSSGSLNAALAASPVTLPSPTGEGQGEAIEYAPDGSAYYTLGERTAPPFVLKRVDRR